MARLVKANRKTTSRKITSQYSSGFQKGVSETHEPVKTVLEAKVGPNPYKLL